MYAEPEYSMYNPRFLAKVHARRRQQEAAEARARTKERMAEERACAALARQREIEKRREELERIALERARMREEKDERVARAAYRRIAKAEKAMQRRDKAEGELDRLRTRQRTKLDRITYRICSVMGIAPSDLMKRSRETHFAVCRQAICYWACRLTDLSLGQIGGRVGGIDHTTVLHAKTAYPKKRAAMGRHLRPAR